MATPATTSVEKARRVTDEEVAHYQEHGWVKLEALISPDVAAAMLETAKGVMGEEPDGADDMIAGKQAGDRIKETTTGGKVLSAMQWQDYHYIARDDKLEPFYSFSFSKEIGENVQRLMARDIPVRYYTDMVACKMPAGQPGGRQTNWHQDLCNFPLDRAGGMSVWVALVDCPPEKGTMRFLPGSFREGPLGRVSGTSMLDYYPHLRERYELTPPQHLRAGDATVHNSLTFHFAPENTTDSPRWAFVTTYMPGDVLYTGSPHGAFEGTGIGPYQPLDHPRFPIVYPTR